MARFAFLLTFVLLGTGCGLLFDDRGEDGGTASDAALAPRDAARPRDASRIPDGSVNDAGQRDSGARDAGSRTDGGVLRDASLDAGPAPLDGGAPCIANSDCRVTEHCQREVGTCLGPGRCTTRPTGCPDVHIPVCGCDWVSYGNACEARAAGASIQADGDCVIPVGSTWCGLTPTLPDFGICNRCFDDADCGGFFPICVASACRASGEGICAGGPLGAGDCYTDRDCEGSERCVGAVLDECLPSQGSCEDP